MKKEYSVSIVIPVYKPDEKFKKLMEGLKKQTYPAEKILIINTEKSYWKEDWIEGIDQAEVHHIRREEFDHGGTRAWAAGRCSSDLLIFFTQDAVLADEFVVEKLAESFACSQVAAAYARQLPNEDCGIVEQYTRSFNYPDKSRIKSKEDLPELGIKTFFCSNVCAAYRRSVYEELGGFITHTIFNEDMIMAGNMILAGYSVAYRADACVIHSHNYGNIQQFKRNFDLAVSQAEHPEVFEGIRSENEGMRLVKSTVSYLISAGKPWLIPELIIKSGFKFLGYRLGKNYKNLPKWIIRACTMNQSYWTAEE